MPLPVGVNQVKQLAVFQAHFNRHKFKKKTHNPGCIRTFTKEQEIHGARERRSGRSGIQPIRIIQVDLITAPAFLSH